MEQRKIIDLVEEEEKVKMGKKPKTREGRNNKNATLSKQEHIKLREGKSPSSSPRNREETTEDVEKGRATLKKRLKELEKKVSSLEDQVYDLKEYNEICRKA